jgi:hypothetical protein
MTFNEELRLYTDKLKKFDWWYMMSDDPSVHENGRRVYEELLEEATTRPAFMIEFNSAKTRAYGETSM